MQRIQTCSNRAGPIQRLTGLLFSNHPRGLPPLLKKEPHNLEVQWRPLANLMKRKQIRTSPINTFFFFSVLFVHVTGVYREAKGELTLLKRREREGPLQSVKRARFGSP